MATTNEQFDLYCEECGKWLDRYNLNDWEITYFHGDLDGAMATCEWNYEAMKATLSLHTGGDEYHITDDNVVRSAHHEVLELLLCEFDAISSLRDLGHVDKYALLASTKHKIIHRLQHHECWIRDNMRKLQTQIKELEDERKRNSKKDK